MIEIVVQSFSIVPPSSVSLLVNLDDYNYLIWKNQTVSFITTYGLNDFIEGTVIAPSCIVLYSEWNVELNLFKLKTT